MKRFGLRQQPFAPTADPSFFFAAREHKSCLYRLWSSIDQRHGIAVILGNYGTGKTTLLRKLMTGMAADPARYNTAVIGSPIPSWTSFALLEAIARQFRLDPPERSFAAYMETLNQYLLANRGRISTLIIDDAQNLNKRGQLELLRLVQNLETPQHKLLNLGLFGQLEWKRVLAAAPNFAQRINLTYTLQALSLDELAKLITFRVQRAGGQRGQKPIFSDNAIEMIHAYSEGNPRLIVTICRNALLLAGRLKKEEVDSDLILHTVEKTTLHDDEKVARLTAVMKLGPRPIIARTPVIRESPFRALNDPRRPTPQNARANQLLLRAAQGRRQSG